MSEKSRADLMNLIRQELRNLRGRNLWRGTEICILPKREIRLETEARGGDLSPVQVVIHLTETEPELWAEVRPGNQKIKISEEGGQLRPFLERLVEICKGGDYLHTNAKTADYRKPFLKETVGEQKEEEGK